MQWRSVFLIVLAAVSAGASQMTSAEQWPTNKALMNCKDLEQRWELRIQLQNTYDELHKVLRCLPFHHSRSAPDHEPADGLLLDRNCEHGARASVRQIASVL